MAGRIGAVMGGLRGNGSYYYHSKKTHCCKEHFNGVAEIQLGVNALKPNEVLEGTLQVSSNDEAKLCKEIFIQLEATVQLEFETTIDTFKSTQKSRKCIFNQAISSSSSEENNFVLSPIHQTLLKDEYLKCKEVFPFRLHLPVEPLPAPFNSSFGSLQYKICVYMRKSCCIFLLSESKPLDFKGHNDLSTLGVELVTHESGLSLGTFSFGQPLTAVMTLGRKGFLPGEEVSFVLRIKNPKQFFVKRITASLVQRTIYNANGRKKMTLLELDTFQDEEENVDNCEELSCVGKLRIPKKCAPTYKINSVWIYTVLHLIQYKIEIEEHSAPLKGEVEIVIGTMRDYPPRRERRKSSLRPSESQRQRRQRSASLASNVSNLSIRKNASDAISQPPDYSQLSSRTESLQSLETLPPNYEDLQANP